MTTSKKTLKNIGGPINTSPSNQIDQIFYSIMLMMIFTLPLVASSMMLDPYEMPKYTLLIFFTAILLFLISTKVALSGSFELQQNPLNLLLGSYLIILALSTVASIRIVTSLWGDSMRHMGFFTLASLVFFTLMFIQLKIEIKKIYIVLFSLVLSSTVISLIGLMKYMGFTLGTPLYSWGGMICSSLGNSNFLGAFLVLTALITLGLILSIRHEKLFAGQQTNLAICCLVSFCLQSACIYFTFSRGSWIGIVAGLLFFWLLYQSTLSRRRLSPRSLFLILLITAGVAIIIITGNLYQRQKTNNPTDPVERLADLLDLQTGGLAERLTLWSLSLQIIENNPLTGTGLDTYGLAFSKYPHESFERILEGASRESGIPDRPHNDFLQTAANIGLPGLVLYLSILLATTLFGLKYLKTNPTEPTSLLLAGLVAGLFGYTVQNLFNFHIIPTAFIFWLTIALIAKLSTPSRSWSISFEGWSNTSLAIKYLLSITLMVFFGLGFYKIGLIPALANRHVVQATLYLTSGQFEFAEQEALKARELMPIYENYSILLGNVYREEYTANKNEQYYFQAVQAYEAATRTNPLERYVWQVLGAFTLKHFEQSGDIESLSRSIQTFKQLTNIDSSYAQSHYNLGVAYYYSEQYDLALVHLKKTVYLDPKEDDAFLLLSKIYLKQGKKHLSIRFLKQAIMANPANERAKKTLKELSQ